MDTTEVDVVVIGAGPAGSTTAAWLARAGHSVLVLERSRFPRFHPGESLLPACVGVLEELGVLDEIESRCGVIKPAVEFSNARGKYGRVPFSAQGPGWYHKAHEVERACFDQTLANAARRHGASVVEQAPVRELVLAGERVVGVRYAHDGRQHEVRARYVVDAGGRTSKVARAFDLRRSVDRLRMVAVYGYFEGVDERNNPGVEGDLQIGGHADGWVWAIPISDRKISIGAVMPRALVRDGEIDRLFAEHVSRIERIAARVAGTSQVGALRVEADYWYYSDTVTGPGWFLVGDAGCFVDPIFSGGVYLAMATGIRAAEALIESLAQPGRTTEAQGRYTRFYKTGYDNYARIVQAYYAGNYNIRPFLRSLGMDAAGAGLGGNQALVQFLNGDLWNKDNLLIEPLHQHADWDTFAPFEREWGAPPFGRPPVPSAWSGE